MSRIIRYGFGGISLIVLLVLIVLFAANPLLRLPAIRTSLCEAISRVIGSQVTAGTIQVDFQQGFQVIIRDLSVTSTVSGISIKSELVNSRFDPNTLWENKSNTVPAHFKFVKPHITLYHNFFSRQDSDVTLPQTLNSLLKADCTVEDGTIDFAGNNTVLSGLFAETSDDPSGKHLTLRGYLAHNGKNIEIIGQGTVKGGTRYEGVSLHVETGDIPLHWIPPVPGFSFTGGYTTAVVEINHNDEDGFRCQLKARLHNPGFKVIWPGEVGKGPHTSLNLEKKYAFEELTLDLDTTYQNHRIALNSGSLTGEDFAAHLGGSLDFSRVGDPALYLRIDTTKLTMPVFRKLFPDPLVSDWLPQDLFPRFSGGHAKLNSLVLNGYFSEIVNLDLPEYRDVLDLDISVEKSQITLQKEDIVFDDCSGRIRITSGQVIVKDVVGLLGNSRVDNGSMIMADLYDDNVLSSYRIPGRFYFVDLLRLAQFELLPEQVRREAARVKGGKGVASGTVEVDYRSSWDWPRITSLKLSAQGQRIGHPEINHEVELKDLVIENTGKGRSRIHGTGIYGVNSFSFSGYLLENFTGSINFEASLPLHFLSSLVSVPASWKNVESRSLVPVNITINRNIGNWRISGAVDLTGDISGPSFTLKSVKDDFTLRFGINITPKKPVDIEYIRLVNGSSVVTATGQWEAAQKRLLLQIDIPGLLLDSFGIEMKGSLHQINGRLSGNVLLDTVLTDLSQMRLTGKLQGRELDFRLPLFDMAVSGGNIDLLFRGKEIEITRGHLPLTGNPASTVKVEGVLQGWSGLTGNILLSSDYLDLTSLYDALKSRQDRASDEKGVKSQVKESRTRIAVSAKIGTCRLKQIQATPVRLTGMIVNNTFVLDRILANLDEGMIGLSLSQVPVGNVGKVGLGRNMTLCFKLADIPLTRLEDFTPGVNDKIAGLLSASGLLTSHGNTQAEYLRNLRGPLKIEIKDGELFQSHAMLSIMEMLSLEKFVNKKPEHVLEDSFYFSLTQVAGKIKDGILTADNMFIHSYAFNGAVKGSIDLNNMTVNSTLAVSPFGSADYLVGKIPLVGYILTGREKSLISYYFRVHGSLFDPEVKYAPLENIPASLTGYVKRILFSPAQVFQNITSPPGDFDEAHKLFVEEIDREFAHALSELPE